MSETYGIFELPDVLQGDEWSGMTLRYVGVDLPVLERVTVVMKSVTNGHVVILDSEDDVPGVTLTRATARDWFIAVGALAPCPFTLGPVTVSVKTWMNADAPKTFVKGTFIVIEDE